MEYPLHEATLAWSVQPPLSRVPAVGVHFPTELQLSRYQGLCPFPRRDDFSRDSSVPQIISHSHHELSEFLQPAELLHSATLPPPCCQIVPSLIPTRRLSTPHERTSIGE